MVISGFNTDIEVEGKVYHIQTEDKGTHNPIVESLVYWKGGEIIASRRTDYSHLLGDGFSKKKVVDIMHSQHKDILLGIRSKTFKFIRAEDINQKVLDETPHDSTLIDTVLDYLEGKE